MDCDLDIRQFESEMDFACRKTHTPLSGTFELTPRCNLRCKMCYVRIDDDKVLQYGTELSAAQWIDLGRQAKEAGTLFIQLTGGEVFLRPDFFEIFEALSDMGLLISISTNATLITKDVAQRLAKRIPFGVVITLYGTYPEAYKRMCGVSAGYEATMAGIDHLIDAGIEPNVQITSTHDNYLEVAKVYEVAKQKQTNFTSSSELFRAREESVVTDSLAQAVQEWEYEDMLTTLIETKARVSQADYDAAITEIELHLKHELQQREQIVEPDTQDETPKGFPCAAARSRFWITWKGELMPCSNASALKVNGLLTHGFSDAWHRMIQISEEQVTKLDKCKACPLTPFCVQCVMRHYYDTDAFAKVSQRLCDRAKGRFRAESRIAMRMSARSIRKGGE